jgi:hypothetical protein
VVTDWREALELEARLRGVRLDDPGEPAPSDAELVETRAGLTPTIRIQRRSQLPNRKE